MFSRKKKSEIPPVEAQRNELLGNRSGPSAPSSYRSAPSVPNGAPGPGGYRSNPGPSGPGGYGSYGAQDPSGDARRNELFKGARAPAASFADRDLDREMDGQQRQATAEDEDEEVEAIKQQMRFTKQESLSSTRNALRIAREAEATAAGTLAKLGDQSDRIANTERQLDMAKAHAARADDNAKEIVALNRSIFRPNFQFNKNAKRNAQEQKMLDRHLEEKAQREETRRQQLESRQRVEGAMRDTQPTGRGGRSGGLRDRLAERSKYQFENTASDDELEGELDSNLDEISALTGRLKTLGTAMGSEIDAQNRQLDTITQKTDNLDTRLYSQTERLKRIK